MTYFFIWFSIYSLSLSLLFSLMPIITLFQVCLFSFFFLFRLLHNLYLSRTNLTYVSLCHCYDGRQYFYQRFNLYAVGDKYSLVQWNWFSDITGCTWVTCIQWRQRTNFTAPGCHLTEMLAVRSKTTETVLWPSLWYFDFLSRVVTIAEHARCVGLHARAVMSQTVLWDINVFPFQRAWLRSGKLVSRGSDSIDYALFAFSPWNDERWLTTKYDDVPAKMYTFWLRSLMSD